MCIVCAGGSAASTASASGQGAPAPTFSLEQIIAQLDRNNTGWADGEVRFSFLDALSSARDPSIAEYQGFSAFTAAQEQATRVVMTLLADVANLTFIETADTGNGIDKLVFANSSTLPDFAWGWANTRVTENNYDPEARDAIYDSEVWVNSDAGLGSYALGTYNFTALMHEIMHGLGVPHPGDYNAGVGGEISYANSAAYQQDSRQYSVMSYWDAFNTGAEHRYQYGATPLLHDIAILQHIYGANTTTRTGDTTYGFNSNAGRSVFDFSFNTQPVVAIWDAGGTDTIDLSGYATPSVIDLREGGFSSFNGMTKNLAIAYGAVIENAIGGGGNDILYGNAAANRLDGRAGADRMEGLGGDDVYVVNSLGDRAIDTGGRDTVYSSVNFNGQVMGAQIEVIHLTGTAVTAIGNGLDNEIHGTSGKNVINGYKGADRMIGYGGNDSYTVDNAGDRVIETADGGYDTVTAVVSHTLNSHVEKLILGGSAGIAAAGNDWANTIVGNAGNNRIAGLGGVDHLTGGAGSDTFVYRAVSDSSYGAYDRIMDLDGSRDIIDLSQMDADTTRAGNQDFQLVDGFTKSAGQITLSYDARAGFTTLLGDVDGDGKADLRIVMYGDHSDFTRILGSDAFYC